MAGGIFISYRRDESQHAAGRLFARLEKEFPRSLIKMDIDSIEPGVDFVKELNAQVAACDVLLAVIGRNWLTATDETGARRLNNPHDFVRIEIEAALNRDDVPVVPVLIDGARLPRQEELPEGLRALVRRHAWEITHSRFAADADGLAKWLAKRVKSKSAVASSPTIPSEELPQYDTGQSAGEQPPVDSGIAPVPPAETEAAERWPIRNASAFAVAAPLFMLMLAEVFNAMNWYWLGAGSTRASGLLAGFLIALGSAVVLLLVSAVPRRAAPGGIELALYWLGCILSLILAVQETFGAMNWVWFGTGPGAAQGSGLFAGFPIALVSALALTSHRDGLVGGIEGKLYWLGCMLALTLGLGGLFGAMNWVWFGTGPGAAEATGRFVGALIALSWAFGQAHDAAKQLQPLKGKEKALYWLGCILAVTLAMGGIFGAKNWSWFGVGLQIPSGMFAGALIAFGSAFVLAARQGKEFSRVELALYWFGCTLSFGFGIVEVPFRPEEVPPWTLWTLYAALLGAVTGIALGVIFERWNSQR